MDTKITEITDNTHVVNYERNDYFYRYISGDYDWHSLNGRAGEVVGVIKSTYKVRIGLVTLKRFNNDKEYPHGY